MAAVSQDKTAMYLYSHDQDLAKMLEVWVSTHGTARKGDSHSPYLSIGLILFRLIVRFLLHPSSNTQVVGVDRVIAVDLQRPGHPSEGTHKHLPTHIIYSDNNMYIYMYVYLHICTQVPSSMFP